VQVCTGSFRLHGVDDAVRLGTDDKGETDEARETAVREPPVELIRHGSATRITERSECREGECECKEA
jgi:hypothetical protein